MVLRRTRAYLKLVQVEQRLEKEGLIDKASNLHAVLLDKAIRTERWRKWMEGDDTNLQVEDILKDTNFQLKS
ncbi:hypothetical protein S101258_00982 [Lactiplantibacillus plantarum subsp. plantarum]|uniref:Uncharacterized protein n=1 Tax=Lactiplantibacillus plantarum subsp. plantarum TaxID=337330 RepID=A0A2S3U7K4_LACPN|nr:hypothetical protein S101258_00982 [Lactiplantibacillus plantarum subsp. plantarum]